MELRQLRAVEAVARHRHFTRAAEELHVAQSALSHQVRRLERELGTPLFERTSRRVVLTPAGERLMREILPGYYQEAARVCEGLSGHRAEELIADLRQVAENARQAVGGLRQ